MNNIFLKNNKGFKWHCNDNIFAKGYFFDNKNVFYRDHDVISYLERINTVDELKIKLQELNGVFTIVFRFLNETFIASDTTRIFPLFYTLQNNEFYISDDIVFLKEKFNLIEIDNESEKIFLASSHTIGNKTILKNIFQTQSNEYIIFKNDIISEQKFFFSYSTAKTNNSSFNKLKLQTINAFDNVFKRLILSLNNRHVALPLSGGYDSRLIATMLKINAYENVTCFTYGKKNNIEVENAKKTAKKLGFKWVFIEYNEKLINGFLNYSEFNEYAHYAGKYSSMPFLQEYFAVKYLKDNRIIPNDSIFIPGHSGDLLGGSQIIKVVNKNLNANEISNLIFTKKFNILNCKLEKSIIIKAIEKNLLNFDANYKEKLAYSVFEDYDIKEKITKYIFNSSSIYTFFGYEHRFPFWDKELLTFFKDVPLKYKEVKLLFDNVLKENYFNKYNLNFENEIQATKKEIFIQSIKNRIKPFLPYFIKKKYLQKNDMLNSYLVTEQILNSLNKNKLKYTNKIKSYNEILLQWYIHFLKN